MRHQVISTSTTLSDIDLYNTKILCHGPSVMTLSLPSISTGKEGTNSEIDNIGQYSVFVLGHVIPPASHAHLYCTTEEGFGIALGGGAETDPVFSASPAAEILTEDISRWNSKLNSETDPVFVASVAAAITQLDVNRWNSSTGGGTRYEPLVNGDPGNPEIMFDGNGDVIMVEV